ncbi:uncharacterized protein LOC123540953 [Mercenaria mercenaria]|uniref:uncharacterized protein LOC123540953 n=1 Tax=Mercenaria mercenaria TaxID=6596 RepID=UPI00234E8568|nr:uncharacterized protein LOC123540953 [Mercenaria mercenaria]
MYNHFKGMDLLLVLGVVTMLVNTAHAECPIHTVSSQGAQVCLTGIGMLNNTIYSHDEICRMYRETLYCVQKQLHVVGLDCNLPDIGASFTNVFSILGPSNYDFSSCKLTPEIGSICTNDERLSQYTLVACGPYLSQMKLYGDPIGACAYSTPLVQCAEQSLGYLSVHCSKFQIEETFRSQSARSFLNRHAKGLDLSLCFKTSGTTDDKNCVDYVAIFSYDNVLGCMKSIGNVNLTDNMDPQDKKMQCSFVQEVLACMVQQLQSMGSHCSMAQMKSALNTYTHLSGMQSTLARITECPNNDSYVSTSMCNDDFRLVSFIATSGNVVLKSLEQYNSKDLVCAIFKAQSDVLMNNFNASCSSSKILSSLTSSFGASFLNGHYPKLDISHCAVGTVTQSDTIKS